MKKTTLAAILTIGMLTLTGCTLQQVTPEEKAALAEEAAEAEAKQAALKDMKSWDGYDRIQVDLSIGDRTDEEMEEVFAGAEAAGRELHELAAQWVDEGEVDELAPVLVDTYVIKSVDELEDPVTYEWTVLSAASVCQHIFDGEMNAEDVAPTPSAEDATTTGVAESSNVVMIICAELF